jgi:hypothetical protein
MPVKPVAAMTSGLGRFSGSPGLDYEIAQEKAASLGRMGRRLEAALAALAAFDAAPRDAATAAGPDGKGSRPALVAEAAEALWMLAVQREAVGLCSFSALLRDYAVPAEVADRMGPRGA